MTPGVSPCSGRSSWGFLRRAAPSWVLGRDTQGSQGREEAAAAQPGQAKWVQPTSKCHGLWLQARVPQPIAAEPNWQGGSPANGHVYSSKHY